MSMVFPHCNEAQAGVILQFVPLTTVNESILTLKTYIGIYGMSFAIILPLKAEKD